MDIQRTIKNYAFKIDREIKDFFEEEFTSSRNISPLIREVLKEMTIMTASGGKRLRGLFVVSSYKLFGGENEKDILRIAAYIELIHAWLLVHDDVMDKADKRRGYDTIHSTYLKKHLEDFTTEEEALHFAQSIAICAGDVLSQLANIAITQSNLSDEIKVRALQYTSRQLSNVAYGQILDIYSSITDVDEEYVKAIYRYKTGEYTYETPLFLGAICAGIKDLEGLDPLKQYSLHGGIAYQIIDDIIDLYNDFEKIGKLPGKDIMEGKKTLLIIKALEEADDKMKNKMLSFLGREDLTKEQIDECKDIIRQTGSLQYSIDTAKKLLNKSSHHISKQTNIVNPEMTEFFIELNKVMLKRIYSEDNNRASN